MTNSRISKNNINSLSPSLLLQLPLDCLKLILNDVSVYDLKHVMTTHSFFKNNLSAYSKARILAHKNVLENNLKINSFTENEYNKMSNFFNSKEFEDICRIVKSNNKLVVVSNKKMGVYRIDNGDLLWSFYYQDRYGYDNKGLFSWGKTWATHDKIINLICSSEPEKRQPRIDILDINNSNTLCTLKHPSLDDGFTTVVGNELIYKINDTQICHYNLKTLKKTAEYTVPKAQIRGPALFINSHYIVDKHYFNQVMIVNRSTHQYTPIKFNDFISKVTMHNDLLICAMENSYNKPDLIIVDMKEGKIISEILTKNLISDKNIDKRLFDDMGISHVKSIVANENMVIRSYKSGDVIILNLKNNQCTQISLNFGDVKLILQDKLLIMYYPDLINNTRFLMYDLNEMKKINQFTIYEKHPSVIWEDGYLFVAGTDKFQMRDFNHAPENKNEDKFVMKGLKKI